MHSIQTMREMEHKLKEAQTAESLQEQYQYLGDRHVQNNREK
jgi:hypothetical protein